MTMKKITIFVICVAFLCIFVLLLVFLRPTTTRQSPTNTNVSINVNSQKVWGSDKDFKSSKGNSLGQEVFLSENYNFSWSIGSGFTYMHFPTSGEAIYSAIISRPNVSTSLEKNRDTLVGFNPKANDEIVFEVYPNKTNISELGSESRATILDQYMWDRGVLNSDVVVINGREVFRTVQRDTEAWPYGYYFLFITPKYLLSFGSADIGDTDMKKLLESVTLGL